MMFIELIFSSTKMTPPFPFIKDVPILIVT